MVDECIHEARVCYTKQLCNVRRAANYSPFICHNCKWLCRGKYIGLIYHLLPNHNTLDTSSTSGTVSETYASQFDLLEFWVLTIFILLLLSSHLRLTAILLDDLVEYAPSNGDIMDIVEEGGSICPLDVLGWRRCLHGPNSGQLDARRTALG
ncbi:hypothetical protein C8F01DRAFT_1175236 [Mycena amicta]|nr:hypothetical protein C8F01DRAFT_1175236 [Mycena amicta]